MSKQGVKAWGSGGGGGGDDGLGPRWLPWLGLVRLKSKVDPPCFLVEGRDEGWGQQGEQGPSWRPPEISVALLCMRAQVSPQVEASPRRSGNDFCKQSGRDPRNFLNERISITMAPN